MNSCVRLVLVVLAAIALLSACAAPREVDRRFHTDTLEMRQPVGPGAVWVLAGADVAGSVWVATPAGEPPVRGAENRLPGLRAGGGER